MHPLLLLALGAGGYAVYEKWTNPSWSPISAALATPSALRSALARVRQTSVPTPDAHSGLDPNMTSALVAEMNKLLQLETDHVALHGAAAAMDESGHENTAHALRAKGSAIADAEACGATKTDIIEAASPVQTAVGWSPTLKPLGGPLGYGGMHGGAGNVAAMRRRMWMMRQRMMQQQMQQQLAQQQAMQDALMQQQLQQQQDALTQADDGSLGASGLADAGLGGGADLGAAGASLGGV